MAGNKNSGQPGGNPNIRTIRKTGPTTEAGKRRVTVANMTHGKHSKLIQQYRARGCNYCPLRAREYTVKFGEKEVERREKPLCAYYKKNSRKCLAPLDDTIARVKRFDELVGENGIIAYDEIIKEAYVDMELVKIREIGTRGAPGKETKEYKELIVKAIMEKEKLLRPQRIETLNKNLNVNVNVSQAIIDAYEEDSRSEKE